MSKQWLRDPIYGDIEISEQVILDLINSREFQRLRRISQLGGGQYVFPSATHTRFTHCIGVYHIITKILKTVPDFNKIAPKDKILVQIAGLLHDLGHGPFSHSFERISSVLHEQYTIKIITDNKSQVHQVLVKNSIDINLVVKIINKTHPNKVLVSLVSSQIDCDRMDYLLRDSYYTGVKYGTFDLEWIIKNMAIKNEEIVFQKKAIYAIENYLLSRYHMYWQIYGHNISLSFDILLKKIMLRVEDLIANNYKFQIDIHILRNLFRKKELTLEQFHYLDDFTFIHLLKSLINEDDKILSDLCQRLINRKFFKVIRNYTDDDKQKYISKLKANKFDLRYYFQEVTISSPTLYTANSMQSIKIIDHEGNIIKIEDKLELIAKNKNEVLKTLILVKLDFDL